MKSKLGRFDTVAYEKIKQLAREVSAIEGKRVGVPEITKRMTNDEISKRILLGAENNRRFGYGHWK